MRGGNGDQQDRRSSGVRYGAVSRAPGAAGAGIRCAARMFARRDSGSGPIVRPGVRLGRAGLCEDWRAGQPREDREGSDVRAEATRP